MRYKKKSRHHLIPKSRWSEFMKTYTKEEKNTTLLLHEDSHRNWHYLFGNKTLDEIIALLQRIKQIKNI